MANTSYLRYIVEPWIRERLTERYGQSFTARQLPLVPGGRHEFDAVSADRRIVVSIKANSGLTSGRNYPTGKVATCLNEVYFLTLVAAEERLLILTNRAFHEVFTRATRGQIANGIEVELVELPADMQQKVDAITRRASEEMGRERAAAASEVEAEEAGERGDAELTRDFGPRPA